MTLTSEHKFELEKMKKELNALKVKCFVQKKKKELADKPPKENLPEKESDSRKIESCFALTSPITNTAATPLLTINK